MIIITKRHLSHKPRKPEDYGKLPYQGQDIGRGSIGITQLLDAVDAAEQANAPIIIVSCLQDLIELGIQKEDVEMV